MLDWLKGFLLDLVAKLLEFLMELLGWFPKKLWHEFLTKIGEWIIDITPPEVFQTAANLMSQWGPMAGYFFDLLEFNWGMSLVCSSIALRYAWSRIPFIGR